jgi:hypothetical protein
MLIEYVHNELHNVQANDLAMLMSVKLNGSEDAYSAQRQLETAVQAVPVLGFVQREVLDAFVKQNQESLEEAIFSDTGQDEDGLSVTTAAEKAAQRETMFAFGLALGCLAIEIMTEPESNILVEETHDHQLMTDGLLSIDLGVAEEVVDEFCTRVFVRREGVSAFEFSEYKALIRIQGAVGELVARHLNNEKARYYGALGATVLFAPLRHIIDAERTKQREEASSSFLKPPSLE